MYRCCLTIAICLTAPFATYAADPAKGAALSETQIETLLKESILAVGQSQSEVEAFCDARVPRMTTPDSLASWKKKAETLRQRVLDEVVFRGQAKQWRDAKCGVQWLEEISGGPGYTIRKLRFEALPGMWIPALLYEPEKITGKVPVVLNVNGHDRGDGKAAEYKQLRCINQAKRGMIALNVEWLGMGQLQSPGFAHYRMNQLDLCGTAGIAPFYLTMSRGLDVLLSLEQADPDRVAVAGLSGGGWQTIFISSLDTRVKLCNPVAGYSSFRTRIRHHSDLGDSEQTPCDLATVADYSHLTAMLAPRAALLTFNIKDNCCFASPHALPPLLEAARPIYALYETPERLAFHVNEDPGTHNFEIDNRQALYDAFQRHFFQANAAFDAKEIDSKSELKSKAELLVEIPKGNFDFQSLARQLSRQLPENAELPDSKEAAKAWQAKQRPRLRQTVKAPRYVCTAKKTKSSQQGAIGVNRWRLAFRRAEAKQAEWTVPAVEFSPANSKGAVIVIADAGRSSLKSEVAQALADGKRVLAIDPFYFGESKIPSRDFLFALLVGAVGERPLGIQAGQLAATADWLARRDADPLIELRAVGTRTSVIALVAAAISPESIQSLELQDSMGSLKEAIDRGFDARSQPELMCFGLLKEFDLRQITALVAPRQVRFRNATARVKEEMKPISDFYTTLGAKFEGW